MSASLKRDAALTATTVSVGKAKLCYILVCDKKLKYENGRSRIAYIGTTKKGLRRVAQSVAARADDILAIHGVRRFEARLVTCPGRQGVKMWHKLERALLLVFKEMYGEVPWCNTHGKKYRERDEFAYFTRRKLIRILTDLA